MIHMRLCIFYVHFFKESSSLSLRQTKSNHRRGGWRGNTGFDWCIIWDSDRSFETVKVPNKYIYSSFPSMSVDRKNRKMCVCVGCCGMQGDDAVVFDIFLQKAIPPLTQKSFFFLLNKMTWMNVLCCFFKEIAQFWPSMKTKWIEVLKKQFGTKQTEFIEHWNMIWIPVAMGVKLPFFVKVFFCSLFYKFNKL